MESIKKLYGTEEYLNEVNSRLVNYLKRDENTQASIYSEISEDETGKYIIIDFSDKRNPEEYLTQEELASLISEDELGQLKGK